MTSEDGIIQGVTREIREIFQMESGLTAQDKVMIQDLIPEYDDPHHSTPLQPNKSFNGGEIAITPFNSQVTTQGGATLKNTNLGRVYLSREALRHGDLHVNFFKVAELVKRRKNHDDDDDDDSNGRGGGYGSDTDLDSTYSLHGARPTVESRGTTRTSASTVSSLRDRFRNVGYEKHRLLQVPATVIRIIPFLLLIQVATVVVSFTLIHGLLINLDEKFDLVYNSFARSTTLSRIDLHSRAVVRMEKNEFS
eukprot:CAMPEP_0115021394 /NCGR_PEP_ID=MMETSP0216-20121206/30861_1 /TAXON_ID=223996 /ORGANISM="Protocruzia adherens, Strain Boccale" /LENGTH=250 /DNA_ID=CAMNT_0002393743 /DNA_START=337 /DNA_END=1086 /DNA_ORIENTATION=+